MRFLYGVLVMPASEHSRALGAAIDDVFRQRLNARGSLPPMAIDHGRRQGAATAASLARHQGWREGYEATLTDLLTLKVITPEGEGTGANIGQLRRLLSSHGSLPIERGDAAATNTGWAYHDGWLEGYEAAIADLLALKIIPVEGAGD